MTKKIGDWICADANGFRVAGLGSESASYDVADGVLMAFGKLSKEVIE